MLSTVNNYKVESIIWIKTNFEAEETAYLKTIGYYHDWVVRVETDRINSAKARVAGDSDALCDEIAKLERQRRRYHNSAVAAAKALNSLCDMLHVERIFDSPTETDDAVRDAIGNEMIHFVDAYDQAYPDTREKLW